MYMATVIKWDDVILSVHSYSPLEMRGCQPMVSLYEYFTRLLRKNAHKITELEWYI